MGGYLFCVFLVCVCGCGVLLVVTVFWLCFSVFVVILVWGCCFSVGGGFFFVFVVGFCGCYMGCLFFCVVFSCFEVSGGCFFLCLFLVLGLCFWGGFGGVVCSLFVVGVGVGVVCGWCVGVLVWFVGCVLVVFYGLGVLCWSDYLVGGYFGFVCVCYYLRVFLGVLSGYLGWFLSCCGGVFDLSVCVFLCCRVWLVFVVDKFWVGLFAGFFVVCDWFVCFFGLCGFFLVVWVRFFGFVNLVFFAACSCIGWNLELYGISFVFLCIFFLCFVVLFLCFRLIFFLVM